MIHIMYFNNSFYIIMNGNYYYYTSWFKNSTGHLLCYKAIRLIVCLHSQHHEAYIIIINNNNAYEKHTILAYCTIL